MLNRRVGGREGKSASLSHSTAGSRNCLYVERSLDTLSKREMDPRLVFVTVRKGWSGVLGWWVVLGFSNVVLGGIRSVLVICLNVESGIGYGVIQ